MLRFNNQKSFRTVLTQIQQSRTTNIFKQALEEDSNREDVWLLYANKVDGLLERYYCLERALRINPANRETAYQIDLINDTVPDQATRKQGMMARVFGTFFTKQQ